ncbi:gamma-glutamyl-gamma-aminobutyrate hydrolase family protein, partial [Pseudonocardia sp. ICBG601]
GAYPAVLQPGSVAAKAYGTREISERHRHRFEVNNAYRQQLTEAGLVFGASPDGTLVEFVELPSSQHPFFVGTQAHPELKSRPTRPHPLFAAFVKAALRYRAEDRLPVHLPGRDNTDADDAETVEGDDVAVGAGGNGVAPAESTSVR